MIDEKNIEKTKILIRKSDRPIIIKSQDDAYNRKILEYGKFDFIYDIGLSNKKSSLRNIDSGFNHVLAEIAKRNKVGICFDMANLVVLDKKTKAGKIEKIRQNIKICKKIKVKMRLLNIRDKKDAFSFMLSLGASTIQAKEAISF